MVVEKYVDLGRHYREVQKNISHIDDYDERISWGIATPLTWSDIEPEFRVVILSEAGSGKTTEIRQAARRIMKSGRYSFFLRMEDIRNGLEDAFDSDSTGDFEEFERWRSSPDEAWVFLDSVDEARLTDPRDFEWAIRKLSKAMGSAVQRAHIFITSRISEWRPNSDLQIVHAYLPYKAPDVVEKLVNVSASDGFDLGLTDPPEERRSSEEDPVVDVVKLLSLAPLDNGQIKKFVDAFRVDDAERFFAEIDREDVNAYLTRPQDLLVLINFWRGNRRIGSRLELMKADVSNRLKEVDPNRNELKPLNPEKALLGARSIAAAVTFQKLSRIKVPDNHNNSEGVDATGILNDWDPPEISKLLARPIFDPAIYGTVRFHHRSIREMLTAEWLSELLREGKSRREIEGLFFRNQYGMDVVVPTTRPILPWLSLLDSKIRDRVLKVSPQVLFETGDPSQLPTDTRLWIIEHLCERIIADKTFHPFIDYGAIRRFAKPDLEPAIFSLLQRYIDKNELHTFLLGMVWHAKLSSCAELTLKVATHESIGEYGRLAAIRALSAVGSKSHVACVISFLTCNTETVGRRVIAEAIECFAPHLMDIETLLGLLSNTPGPVQHSYSGLNHTLEELTTRISVEELAQLLSGLGRLLKRERVIDRGQVEVSPKYEWLLQVASKAAERLVGSRNPRALNEDCLFIISMSSNFRAYYGRSSEQPNFSEIVPNWPDLNKALFWYDVKGARELMDAEKGERLTDWLNVRVNRGYWRFEVQDFDYISDQIREQSLHDNKMVALTLAIYLFNRNGRPRQWRKRLKELASVHPELNAKLTASLRPPVVSKRDAQWEKQALEFERMRQERERENLENDAKWKTWLSSHSDTLKDIGFAAKNTISSAQGYLIEKMRSAAPNRHRWAYSNWHDLIQVYGFEVARAFRDGAVAYWRAYQPALRSEGVENPNSVPHSVIFGLCGLEIEASEVHDWPSNLSEAEARFAVRYALWEMNGFPNWLEALHKKFPAVVRECFSREISWELHVENSEVEQHYTLSNIVWHGRWVSPDIARDVLQLVTCFAPSHLGTLVSCLTIIMREEAIGNREISTGAKKQVSRIIPLEQKATWCAVLVAVDPLVGMHELKRLLGSISDEQGKKQFCMQFAVALVGDGRPNMNVRGSFKKVGYLKELYLVLHETLRIEDDINRVGTGVYTVELRDNAQSARDAVLGFLKAIPGKETFVALRELAERHPNVEARSWMRRHAFERAVLDADLPVWSPDDLREFARDAVSCPTTHRELFDLAVSRLLDLKDDLENGDTSVAGLLMKAEDEMELRNFVGDRLRGHAKGRYSVPQEEELADAKRPDLRFQGNGFDAPVPIELKIADRKHWGGSKLFERLENQLCNDYLRDVRSRSGIFLLVYTGSKQSWQHPRTGEKLDFEELCDALQSHANLYIEKRPDIDSIKVTGIDLTRRSSPKRGVKG
jgi:hypothetical protein